MRLLAVALAFAALAAVPSAGASVFEAKPI
jgi:hypothetical protein